MFKIIKNPNTEIYDNVTRAVKNNSGYCPCQVERNDNTKCICKEFKEQDYEGECHCSRYIKVKV